MLIKVKVILEAIMRCLKLEDDDIKSSSLSPFGIYAKIERRYGNRNLKEIIIDSDHKEVCLLYENSASPGDIAALNKLGTYKVYPIKNIDEDDEVDSFYLESNTKNGICLKLQWR